MRPGPIFHVLVLAQLLGSCRGAPAPGQPAGALPPPRGDAAAPLEPAPPEEPPEWTTPDEVAVAGVLSEWMNATIDADLGALTRLVADDAVVAPAGEVPVRGRAAVRERYRLHFRDWRPRGFLFPERILVDGDAAAASGITEGHLVPQRGGAIVPYDTRFTAVLTRGADGAWLVQRYAWVLREGD